MYSKLLLLAVVPVHFFFLYSILDIYFTSPLTTNVNDVPVTHKRLADRLVLYVVDGLRANKLFFDEMNNTPFLKHMVQAGHPWGLSHTRVPTETRPGHVALIAGFYEDVSSITKGWQENAVEFDSVFNRSSRTWAWGSPDVLPMFQRGAVPPDKIITFVYEAALQDFSTKQTWDLDTWVFDRVKVFFKIAASDKKLSSQLRKPGVILFLHLLGMDVSGHAQKPNSKPYLENLRIVDRGIERMSRLIDTFYGDNATAHLVTSDHGMTNWGSHGDGSLDETETPVMAWGRGLRQFKHRRGRSDDLESVDPTQQFVHATAIRLGAGAALQQAIWQADLCPLMASLLGLPIPYNSVGVVPLLYLEVDLKQASHIRRHNVLQLFAQFRVKYETRKNSRLFFFQEFSRLSMRHAYEILKRGDNMIEQSKFKEVMALYNDLPQLLLDGLQYYHKYDQLWLGFLIFAFFILWMILMSTFIVPCDNSELSVKTKHIVVLTAFVLFYAVYNVVEKQPISYIFYETCPTFLLFILLTYRYKSILVILRLLKNNFFFLVGICILIECLVWSFFYRAVLVVGVVIMFALISLSGEGQLCQVSSRFTPWGLSAVCLNLMVYPTLPVIGGYRNYLLVILGALLNCSIFVYLTVHSKPGPDNKGGLKARYAFILLQLFIMLNVCTNQFKIQAANKNLLVHQIVSWSTLISVFPAAIMTSSSLDDRVHLLFSAMSIIYNMLSIYYELIFFFSLIVFCLLWMDIEKQFQSEAQFSSHLDQRKIIQTLIYVFLITYSFFSTGNMASINSFDVHSIYCFVTVFHPFLMMLLMLLKLLLPMMVVSVAYVVIQQQQQPHSQNQQHSPSGMLPQMCLVTIVTDAAALHFLFMIQDHGSWLQIGTSISHYVIAMGISICAFLLTLLSKVILMGTLCHKVATILPSTSTPSPYTVLQRLDKLK